MSWVRFTGDYSKLKSMGFEFQRLYARNYMQWHKNGVRVWKRGNEVTGDDINPYKLITFVKQKPLCRTYDDGSFTFVKHIFHVDGERHYEYLPMTDENTIMCSDHKLWADDELWSFEHVLPEFRSTLKELSELGWLELAS